jgi:hypothetical protein
VGGLGGEVWAKSPSEAWAKFEREVRPEIERRLGLFLESPRTREDAMKSMWQDPDSHAWILDYYFSS